MKRATTQVMSKPQNELLFQLGDFLYDHFEPSEVSKVR